MSDLQFYLFGRFRLQHNGTSLGGIEAPKAQELLCYLLLHNDRPHSREKLANLMWAESTTAQSRKQLRHIIWQVHNILEQQQFLKARLLCSEADWIEVNPALNIWLDVAEFARAYRATRGFRGRELNADQFQALQGAVSLYTADLLEGWYHDWCIFEREQFQNMYLTMLDKLMDYCEHYRLYDQGIEYGASILRYDPAREKAYRRLIRLHYLAGERTVALRLYEQCAAALQRELAVEPSERTKALYRQIRDDWLGNQRPETTPDSPATGRFSGNGLTARRPPSITPRSSTPVGTENMEQVLLELKSWQDDLNQLQQQLLTQIQFIERYCQGNL